MPGCKPTLFGVAPGAVPVLAARGDTTEKRAASGGLDEARAGTVEHEDIDQTFEKKLSRTTHLATKSRGAARSGEYLD
jgi:hypothetical protein